MPSQDVHKLAFMVVKMNGSVRQGGAALAIIVIGLKFGLAEIHGSAVKDQLHAEMIMLHLRLADDGRRHRKNIAGN